MGNSQSRNNFRPQNPRMGNQLEYKSQRCVSQNMRAQSVSKMSVKTSGSRALSRASRSLSQMSKTSQKSVKYLNASLERIHTFGMSNIHKSLYDLEKIDTQYDSELNQKGKKSKQIQKTTSMAKLKSAINQNLPSETGEVVMDDGATISVNVSIKNQPRQAPVTSLKFMDPNKPM